MLSMRPSQACTIAGVILNAIGVIMLFFYGMPFRIRKEGEALLVTRKSREDEKRDASYDVRARVGLALIIVGSLLQIAGTII